MPAGRTASKIMRVYTREYEDGNHRQGLGRGCISLLVLTCAVFAVQLIADKPHGMFTSVLSLSRAGIARFWFWQFFTYMFVHYGTAHLFFNMLGLYVFGRDVEDCIGTARFVILYLACGFIGGGLWLLFAGRTASCLGASGAVCGLLGTYAAFFPDRKMLLLFPPIVLKARTLAIGYALFSVFLMVDGVHGGGMQVAHSIHLTGGIAGYVYGWRTRKTSGFLFGTDWSRWRPFRKGLFGGLRAGLRRRNMRLMDPDPDYRPERDEVDRILEKLNTGGMSSLTRWEREVLERARKNGFQ